MKKSKSINISADLYLTKLMNTLDGLSLDSGVEHPYFNRNDTKRVLFIVYSTKRGLCGGLPTNILKSYLDLKNEYFGNLIDVIVVGNKINNKIKNDKGVNVIASYENFGDDINSSTVDEVLSFVKIKYKSEDYRTVQLIYPYADTSFSQKVKNVELLPINRESFRSNDKNTTQSNSFKIEPNPETLLDVFIQMYLQSSIYNAFIQTITAEYSARMLAMKNASDNAVEIKKYLVQEFNKSRQAQITKELAEITAAL